MFLDVKELAARKLRIHKAYAPGSIDFHSAEIKQIEPLEVNATAELMEDQIRVEGNLETKVELVCARCLEPVTEEVSRSFDLFYAPLPKDSHLTKHREDRLKDDDTDIGFYEGDGLFLADVLKEQVLLRDPRDRSAVGLSRAHQTGLAEKTIVFPGQKPYIIRPMRRE